MTLCSCLNWAGGRGILTPNYTFLSINLPLSFREVSNFCLFALSKKTGGGGCRVGCLTRKFGDRGKCNSRCVQEMEFLMDSTIRLNSKHLLTQLPPTRLQFNSWGWEQPLPYLFNAVFSGAFVSPEVIVYRETVIGRLWHSCLQVSLQEQHISAFYLVIIATLRKAPGPSQRACSS